MFKNLKKKYQIWVIESICHQFDIFNYKINDDMIIDVVGDVDFRGCRLKKIPLRFGTVTGCFDCSYNRLTSLDGAPHTVNGTWTGDLYSPGNFWCRHNRLTSLEGGPQNITGIYYALSNELTTLKGGPITCQQLQMYTDDHSRLMCQTRIDTINEILS